MNSESFKAARARLSPWDENLPTKFVEFEIRRKFKSIRRCMHVPKLCRIDELVPTTNFMSELGNIAEFMYSVGRCVISREEPRADPTTIPKAGELISSDDEGVSDLASSAGTASPVPARRTEALMSTTENVATLRPRRKRVLSVSADGFLADEEDNDDDEESSGFYSDASECTIASQPLPRRGRTFRTRAGLYYHSQLPMWLRNNEFIVSGHRPPAYSYTACLRSMFQLHSETGNIWSHALGAIGCAAYAVYFYAADVIPGLDAYDRLAFAVFFLAAIGCMAMSAIYHTLACHSNKVCTITCKLDFTGITVLIFGSFFSWLYFTFYDHPNLRCLYGITGTASALATIKMSLSDDFAQAHYRGVRSAIYIAYAMICGVLPVVHFCLMYGLPTLVQDFFILRFACMVAAYVVGAVFYSIRVPEKYWPGRFDYAGQSHQIMHVCVIFGNLAHYWGCHGLAYRRTQLSSSKDVDGTIYVMTETALSFLRSSYKQLSF
ncbi:adiponectin receptor protein 1-like [Tropilaelaps mercedesae]|uniref:Adiponectin receptor protein 1-like n=1 Tax=Tropilaelaps mercedesae TaxID=418985 RepID=A0A1V9X4M8_9ACAR|nr:adiponectin receptor protein 1-like [Tropilaelaps mercedesae]